MDTIKIFASITDDATRRQVEELAASEAYRGCTIRVMPDCHAGKGCTVGTVIELKDRIVPNTVGVDIGCGMYVVPVDEREIDLQRLDAVVNERVPSGFSIHEKEVRHFHGIEGTLYCRAAVDEETAQRSIGTLGGGNHFIEVDRSDGGDHYLVIHSGSRNLGVRICGYYQEMAEKACGIDPSERRQLIDRLKAEGRQREISGAVRQLRPKVWNMVLAYLDGSRAEDYLHDMAIAQRYAEVNREAIADIIFSGMGWRRGINAFHTTHNYIDIEAGVLRKGAISARKGEKVIIPMNMRDGSLICIGKGNEDWLCSAPHGAGRIMSRAQAFREVRMADFRQSMEGIFTTSVCEGTLDEAPQAYKPADVIRRDIEPAVEILEAVRPIWNFKAKTPVNGRKGTGTRTGNDN